MGCVTPPTANLKGKARCMVGGKGHLGQCLPLEHPGKALERQLVLLNRDLNGHWVRGLFMELPSLWRTEHLQGKGHPWGERLLLEVRVEAVNSGVSKSDAGRSGQCTGTQSDSHG